ncbi:MAG: rane protein [Frankiales bacterium]|nr:rane protein [Frankiales bacterium]
MDPWIWWLVIAAACGIVEVLTLDLIFAMFGAGAVAACVTALGTDDFLISAIVFAVVSVGMLGIARPVALRHLKQGPDIRTGIDALPGSRAVVLERVDEQHGLVKLAGEVWTARAYDPAAVLEEGASVDVVEIRGATAYVL